MFEFLNVQGEGLAQEKVDVRSARCHRKVGQETPHSTSWGERCKDLDHQIGTL